MDPAIVKVEKFNNLCMICAEDNNTKNIFDVHYFNGKSEICAQIIISCFKIKFLSINCKSNDAVMCEKCLRRLEDAYTFKTEIKRTLELFNKQMLTTDNVDSNIKKKHKSKIKNDVKKNDTKSDVAVIKPSCDQIVNDERIRIEMSVTDAEILNNTMVTDARKTTKLKRKLISLEEKIKILDRLKFGERIMSVSKELDLNESTIRSIKENENKIRAKVSVVSSASIGRVARVKNIQMAKMENILMIWIEDCSRKNVPLNNRLIKQKAVRIYTQLKEIECDDSNVHKSRFVGSKGWYKRFKNRFSLHNSKIPIECSQ